MDSDRALAEIGPPEPEGSSSAHDGRVGEAERIGLIARLAIRSATPPPRAPVAALSAILAELDEDRAER